ncbi:MAG: rod shape-determining protein [Lachnospiraceae bacterium]|nr:rod shape-determining protein [Lachnospiraceae bacterium]
MAEYKEQGNLVFGLDIGTRSIVGTVGYREGDVFNVLAQESKEHETRAMLDGQIHNISQVGNTIAQVKKQLEKKLEVRLSNVCIAAAGRVLETVEVNTTWELEKEKVITPEDVAGLTSMGIEKAYAQFQAQNTSDMHFYCVGNSVIRYYLNGYQIGNLENHKARTIGADMIATFLPDDVVDGLYKAVELAGLRVVNMTLEPIAAISVAIPEMYRMLNIGLVDVGAGTSDICITKDGCIVAYGMIPCAGDFLTEAIARACLVDFNTAEHIKRGIETADTVEYNDIMGLPQTITKEAVLQLLDDNLEEMTARVAEKFKELNGGKPVSAVFVVGGGGRIAGYTQKLSAHLGIVAERVAVRGEEVMQKIRFKDEDSRRDSLMITPIGICLNYYEQSNNFIYVTFNEEHIKIYDSGNLAVVDAAMHANFPNEGLFPRRGREINYTINGRKTFKRGQLGEAARITVNGEPADMHTQIRSNDVIVVEESTVGEPAKIRISDLPEFKSMIVINANDSRILLPKVAYVNGEAKTEYYEIREGDDIVMQDFYTVRQVREFMDVLIEDGTQVFVNNEPADDDTKVYENFTIRWGEKTVKSRGRKNAKGTHAAEKKAPEDTAAEADSFAALPEDDGTYIPSGVQGAPKDRPAEKAEAPAETADKTESEADREDKKTGVPMSILVRVNGKQIRMSGKSSYVFVDVFDYIDFDLQSVKGSKLITDLNGHKAEYMEAISSGDEIVIRWEK